jgi:hypothetical protein
MDLAKVLVSDYRYDLDKRPEFLQLLAERDGLYGGAKKDPRRIVRKVYGSGRQAYVRLQGSNVLLRSLVGKYKRTEGDRVLITA